ncbi:MAG: hypothetical protein QUS35_00540, partial [bacterium]|nr:hypothetical protein [bacterium]
VGSEMCIRDRDRTAGAAGACGLRIGASPGDTLAARRSLRKTWNVAGWPVFATVRFASGSACLVRVNGSDVKPAGAGSETDVSGLIVRGRNRIEVFADAAGPFWLEACLSVQYVPDNTAGAASGTARGAAAPSAVSTPASAAAASGGGGR